MINDLRVREFHSWKYVDDTTVAEIVPRGESSNIQSAVHAIKTWWCDQRMTLNADKCKVMNMNDFEKNKHAFAVTFNGKDLSVVSPVKILGVTLSKHLTWNDHISEAIKKANKRLYFLVLLRRAGVDPRDIINFYCSVIKPVLEYCSSVFDHALPEYLSHDIERVQKRALSIILPDCCYSLCLSNHNLDTLQSRREEHCSKLFDSISNDHKLSHLFPTNHVNHYNLRRIRKYDLPGVRIPSMCRLKRHCVNIRLIKPT
ncbi:uncharacterized protein LOC111329769 [Stylophora pistillata]|uniref:uncharacterized protein LOC111329769 n=1 Tax=Stylophora pistillata TaxID=50429 RepID=UPI000C04455B|nr:uncharacterized protein LOC111329769 [Stylophora pistillata]